MIASRIVIVGFSAVLLYLLWARINLLLFNDFFSPFNLLFFFWICPILIRGLNLSWLESPWNYKTILAVSMVTFIFVGVSLFPLLRNKHLRTFSEGRHFFNEMLSVFRDYRVTCVLIASYILLFSLYIYVEFVTNPAGFELFNRLFGNLKSEDVSYYGWGKTQGRSTLVSLANTLTSFLLILNPIFYLKARLNRRFLSKLIFMLFAFLTTIFGLIKLSKFDVMWPLWGIILAEYYYRRFVSTHNRRASLAIKNLIIILLVLVIPSTICDE